MNLEVLITCLLIVASRVADVSLGTLRTVAVVYGRRWLAFGLGFVEVAIWLVVIERVLGTLNDPVYLFAYALGYALGNWMGITVEAHIGFGKQVLRVFTRQGPEMVDELRDDGYVVTCFEGAGREGPISMLFLEAEQRNVRKLQRRIRAADPDCFYIVDDVRLSSGKHRMQRAPFRRWSPKRK